MKLATLAPLVKLLTQNEHVQLLEKVYFQLQQVLDDPQCSNDPYASERVIQLLTGIIPNVDPKFRDEFILQRFAILAAQNNHCGDKEARKGIAEALLVAYNTTNCCYVPESTVRRLVCPALKCLSLDFHALEMKDAEEELIKLTKEVEAKLPSLSAGGISSFLSPNKDRTASVSSTASNISFNTVGQTQQASLNTIMSSTTEAAEAAKSKFEKFKQHSKTLFNK